MGVALNCNWRYWDSTTSSDTVGWPQGSASTPWAYQRLAQLCPTFRAAGFTVIVLPPSTEGAAGIFSGGYDKRDDYGIDTTAFGTGEMLRQLIAVAHANGLEVYGDLVLHQYGGGHNGVYDTKRFPKTPQCFANTSTVGGVNPDTVPDENGNFPFGDLSAYQHSIPAGYMHDGAIAATLWLTETAGFDGFRIDDAKGTNASVVYDILHSPSLESVYAFFEYFDGSPDPVSNYVNGYEKRRGPVMDFAFKFNMGNICNNQGRVWMGSMADIGYCTKDAAMALTFVESADTDTSIGQQTIWNKMLAYAAMLTYPGYPEVYYRDWASDPLCYGLKSHINNLVWIHEYLAQGDYVVRLDTDPQVFVMERMGYGDAPGCLVAFNNDPSNAHTVTVQAHWPVNTRLHEYSGLAGYNSDRWVQGNGTVTLTIPRNDNGLSYVVYAPWIERGAFGRPARKTTQVFYGAVDLDIGAAMNGTQQVARFDCAAGSAITSTISADTAGWTQESSIAWQIIDPDGNPQGGSRLGVNGNAINARSTAAVSGWHRIVLTSAGLPEAGASFSFKVTYTAPTTPTLEFT